MIDFQIATSSTQTISGELFMSKVVLIKRHPSTIQTVCLSENSGEALWPAAEDAFFECDGRSSINLIGKQREGSFMSEGLPVYTRAGQLLVEYYNIDKEYLGYDPLSIYYTSSLLLDEDDPTRTFTTFEFDNTYVGASYYKVRLLSVTGELDLYTFTQ